MSSFNERLRRDMREKGAEAAKKWEASRLETPQFAVVSVERLSELEFREKQIEQLNALMDEMEDSAMSLMSFFDRVGDIL